MSNDMTAPDTQPSPDRDALEYLMLKVTEMRQHQRDYFARKQETDKRNAMRLEREVDAIMLKLKGRGYTGERFRDKTKQGRLM